MNTSEEYKRLSAKDKRFLLDIAKEIAMLVDIPEKMDYFQKQLTEFADKWGEYKAVTQADSEGKWQPSMGKPGNPLDTIWPPYISHPGRFPYYLYPRGVRTILGAYALLGVINDKVLPHCPSIAKGIFPKELTEKIWKNIIRDVETTLNKDKIKRCLSNITSVLETLSKEKEAAAAGVPESGGITPPITTDSVLTGQQKSAEAKQKIEPREKGGQNKTDDIAIDDKELTILTELSEGSNKTYMQIEIEATTSIPRGTIKDKLPRLEKIGLVHRPLGERKGYQITEKGREIVKRNE